MKHVKTLLSMIIILVLSSCACQHQPALIKVEPAKQPPAPQAVMQPQDANFLQQMLDFLSILQPEQTKSSTSSQPASND